MPVPSPRKGEEKSKFIARFMSSAQMRREFPDPSQRRAVAESAWDRRKRRQMRKSADVFSAVKGVLVECCKQDIPEVQSVISILEPAISTWWDALMDDAFADAERRLMELEDEMPTIRVDGLVLADLENRRERTEALLLLAFITVLDRAARSPLPARIELALTRGLRELMNDGAASLGLELDLAQEPTLRAAARDDLRALLQGRVATRRAALRNQAREFLNSARARARAREGDIRPPPAPPFRARSLQEWRSQTRELLGLPGDTWIPQVIDQWAYRWFVIGQFRASRQAGFMRFRARAVRDSRTTRFCLRIDGRIVSTSRMERQVDRHVQASIAGDEDALIKNWPMLPSSITASQNNAVIDRAFKTVGLPPYHFRCRTTIEPVR
jgi:hypothetical protein